MSAFAVGWRQVGVCFVLLAAISMIASTYSIVAIPLAREFQPSRMVLMLAMTVLSGVSALLSPFVGALMDRVSLRRLIIIGGVLLGLGYAAISFATTFPQVLLAFGLLIAPANVLLGPLVTTVLLSRWFSQQRGRAMGIAISGISAGAFLFPFIVQGLLAEFAWREAMRWLGLVLLMWTLPAAMLVVDHPSSRGLGPDGESESVMSDDTKLAAGVPARVILGDPAFWVIAFTVAIVTSGLKGMITNLAPLAVDTGVDVARASALVSIYAGCGFMAKLNFAALADRLGPRVVMSVSLLGFSLAMTCLTQADHGYWMIVLGVSLAGLFGGLMIPVESYLAPRVFGHVGVGRAMGLLSGTILVALLLTPPLFGLIFDLFGSYRAVFWVFGALAITSLIWVRTMRLTARGHSTPKPTCGLKPGI